MSLSLYPITTGGSDKPVPVIDAHALYDECMANGLDVSWWYPHANTITNVAGEYSSVAYLLIPKLYIDGMTIATAATYGITLTEDIKPIRRDMYNHKITLMDGVRASLQLDPISSLGWVFHSAQAIDASNVIYDPNAVYLVKFVDKRWLWGRQPNQVDISGALTTVVRTGFNVVSPTVDDAGMGYDATSSTDFPYDVSTLSDAGPFSFESILNQLWSAFRDPTDNFGLTMGFTEEDFPFGGDYPGEIPLDIRPENKPTWKFFCELLHATGNEIYPKLDGTFEIHPIDAHLGQPDVTASSLTTPYLIDTGFIQPEDKMLPEQMTMTYLIRDKSGTALNNANQYATPGIPIDVIPDLIDDDDYDDSGSSTLFGTVTVSEIVPGVIEDVTTIGMTAVYDSTGHNQNAPDMHSFAVHALTKYIGSKADNQLDQTFGYFIDLTPNPQTERIIWFIGPGGPCTRFVSESSSVGVQSVPPIPGGISPDRKVAADDTDNTPKTLFPKLEKHGTFNNTDYQYVYAEVVTDPGTPKDNQIRLFTAVSAGGGGTGPAGADGDTITNGYCIDVTHVGTVATPNNNLTEATSFVDTSWQFITHIPVVAGTATRTTPFWQTVTGFVSGDNQFIWHKSGNTWNFVTTDDYHSDHIQVLVNNKEAAGTGKWNWMEAGMVRSTNGDTTLKMVHDEFTGKVAGTPYTGGRDFIVANQTDGGVNTNQTERLFVNSSLITGWSGSVIQYLTHSSSGNLTWAAAPSGGGEIGVTSGIIPGRASLVPGIGTVRVWNIVAGVLVDSGTDEAWFNIAPQDIPAGAWVQAKSVGGNMVIDFQTCEA